MRSQSVECGIPDIQRNFLLKHGHGFFLEVECRLPVAARLYSVSLNFCFAFVPFLNLV